MKWAFSEIFKKQLAISGLYKIVISLSRYVNQKIMICGALLWSSRILAVATGNYKI